MIGSPKKIAVHEVEQIRHDQSRTLIVHYACETFPHKPDAPVTTSGRIVAIVVRNFLDDQVWTFSLYQIALNHNITAPSRIRGRLNVFEKELIESFFQFARSHASSRWLNWSMKDAVFGFESIENRYLALGGSREKIPVFQPRSDLKSILGSVYGGFLCKRVSMKELAAINGYSFRNFLDGEEEGKLALTHQYARIHPSVIEKTEIFRFLLRLHLENRLATHRLDIRPFMRFHRWMRPNTILGFVASVIAILTFVTGWTNWDQMRRFFASSQTKVQEEQPQSKNHKRGH